VDPHSFSGYMNGNTYLQSIAPVSIPWNYPPSSHSFPPNGNTDVYVYGRTDGKQKKQLREYAYIDNGE
jgi:hypothetical protein